MDKSIFDNISKIAEELNDITKKPEENQVEKIDRYIDEENKERKVEHEPEITERNRQSRNDKSEVIDTNDGIDMETVAYEEDELDEIIKTASEMNVGMNDVINMIEKIAEEFGDDVADCVSAIILSTSNAQE